MSETEETPVPEVTPSEVTPSEVTPSEVTPSEVTPSELTVDQKNSIHKLLSVVDQDGDGSLDKYELHSVLVAHGILVPVDVVLSLFEKADTNGDGSLSLEEFGKFVLASDGFKKSDLVKSFFFDRDFWAKVFYVAAGIMLTVGAHWKELSLSSNQIRDIFFSAAIMYLIPGLYYFTQTPVNTYKAEKSYETNVKKLVSTLQKNATDSQALPREEGSPDCEPGQTVTKVDDTEVIKAISEEDHVNVYIRDVIFADRKTLNKTDLSLLLLKSIGAYDSAMLLRILAILDEDGGGTIDVDEFQAFVKLMDETTFTLKKRLIHVLKSLSTNFNWMLLIFFVMGPTVSILNTLSKMGESDGIWVNENFTPAMFSSYSANIGMIYFVNSRVQYLIDTYNMREMVRSMLRGWLNKSEEDWTNCDKKSFNSLLEENAIFLPKFQIDALFRFIDKDGSDSISKKELEVFVNIKRKKFPTVFMSAMKDIIFWANFVWLVGCGFYLAAEYILDVQYAFYIVGGWCFLLGGIIVFISYVQVQIENLLYAENVRHAIATLLP